jgi:hypothetical protein
MIDPRIHSVFVFPDGMVAVTDGRDQLPEYQGRYDDVASKITEAATARTKFYGWPGKEEPADSPIRWNDPV